MTEQLYALVRNGTEDEFKMDLRTGNPLLLREDEEAGKYIAIDDNSWTRIPVSIVRTDVLEDLQNSADWLEYLERAGVNDWEGCDKAQDLVEEDRKKNA